MHAPKMCIQSKLTVVECIRPEPADAQPQCLCVYMHFLAMTKANNIHKLIGSVLYALKSIELMQYTYVCTFKAYFGLQSQNVSLRSIMEI